MSTDDTKASETVSEDALAKAEQKLQIEADKRVRDAAIAAGKSTEPQPEPRKPQTDPAV